MRAREAGIQLLCRVLNGSMILFQVAGHFETGIRLKPCILANPKLAIQGCVGIGVTLFKRMCSSHAIR